MHPATTRTLLRHARAALLLLALLPAAAQDRPDLEGTGLAFDTDVPYGAQSPAQILDILYPADAAADARPAVVHIHGGGWYTGGKGGQSTFNLLKALADRGYVGVSIAYRLSDEAKFPAAVEDARLAIRWLRANAAAYRIAPDHIGAIGASAGGHLSAMLAVTADAAEFDGAGGLTEHSSAIQAAVPVCGPMDLRQPLSHKLGLENDDVVIRFLGGTPIDLPEPARRASPAAYVRPGLPPMLLIHGTDDRRVELEQSTRFAEALQAAGSPADVIAVQGGKHGMGIAREPEMVQRIIGFFDVHLRG